MTGFLIFSIIVSYILLKYTPSPLNKFVLGLALIGIVIHELCHFLMCVITNAPTKSIKLLERIKFYGEQGKKYGYRGSVTINTDKKLTFLQAFFIGFAPLIFSFWLFFFILDLLFTAELDAYLAIFLVFVMVSIVLSASPSAADILNIPKAFLTCKYLLMNIIRDNRNEYNDIESIDEAAESLNHELEITNRYNIPPEIEFWGHCSNLQAWAENNYDTRLLHSNMAFPLLRKLTQVGDPQAKKIFKDEIAKRFSSGYLPVMKYLVNGDYLNYLNTEEVRTLLESNKHQISKSEYDSMIRKISERWQVCGEYNYRFKNFNSAIKFFR